MNEMLHSMAKEYLATLRDIRKLDRVDDAKEQIEWLNSQLMTLHRQMAEMLELAYEDTPGEQLAKEILHGDHDSQDTP